MSSSGPGDASTERSRALRSHFLVMCAAFSINISCVISCLSYATAILGHLLGGYGGGVLYVFSASTALFGSNPVVATLGPRGSLLLGLGFYCVYVSGFLVAVIVHHKYHVVAWVSFLSGSMFGGIASGIVWTAQGKYLSLTVRQYAAEVMSEGVGEVNVTNHFAGLFACIFLGTECSLRAFASLFFIALPSAATYDVVFSVYGSLAVLSLCLMTRVHDMGETGSRIIDASALLADSSSAVHLVCSDLRLLLLIPFQMSVGLAFSFVPFYVFGTIIADSDNLGSAYVGLISACIPLTGSAMAFPTASVASTCGKPLPMTVGAVGLGFAGLAVMLLPDDRLGTWPVIMAYIVIYGVGRGVYENTNKAVIVEFFNNGTKSNDVTAAFAATNFARNIASAFGYFAFNHISRFEMALLVFASAGVGLLCYYAAHARHQLLTSMTSEALLLLGNDSSDDSGSSHHQQVTSSLLPPSCSSNNQEAVVGGAGAGIEGCSSGEEPSLSSPSTSAPGNSRTVT